MLKHVRFLSVALLVMAALIAGCGQTFNVGNTVTGSGTSKTETREVSGFHSVLISGSGTVTISVTGTESLTIEADDNILPYLTSDVSNGRLELGTKPNSSISPKVGPLYTLTVKSLDDIDLSGSANATITDLNADTFSATISGSGTIRATGRADNLTVNISGSGNFTGDAGLTSKIGSVTISGSGLVVVNASDTLKVNLTGSGNVEYIGSPVVDVQSSGSGKVSKH